jgi:DNA-directed RNA polymerase subunit RPC12/RpoP
MADDPTPAAKPLPVLDAPMAAWVKGGTTTLKYDLDQEREHAEAEARRDAQDAQQQIVRQNPTEARMHSMKLGGRSTSTMIVLGIRHPKDNQILWWQTCELSMQPNDELHCMQCGHHWEPTGTHAGLTACPKCQSQMLKHVHHDPELVLQMVCMRCWQRGVRMDKAQMQIRQSHRMFWLNEKRKGELWVNPDDPTEVVTLAGTITTEGWVKCSGLGCTWEIAIDDSVVRTK